MSNDNKAEITPAQNYEIGLIIYNQYWEYLRDNNFIPFGDWCRNKIMQRDGFNAT